MDLWEWWFQGGELSQIGKDYYNQIPIWEIIMVNYIIGDSMWEWLSISFGICVSPMRIPCAYLELFGKHQGVFFVGWCFLKTWCEWNGTCGNCFFPTKVFGKFESAKKDRKKVNGGNGPFHIDVNVFWHPFPSWIRSIKEPWRRSWLLHSPLSVKLRSGTTRHF